MPKGKTDFNAIRQRLDFRQVCQSARPSKSGASVAVRWRVIGDVMPQQGELTE